MVLTIDNFWKKYDLIIYDRLPGKKEGEFVRGDKLTSVTDESWWSNARRMAYFAFNDNSMEKLGKKQLLLLSASKFTKRDNIVLEIEMDDANGNRIIPFFWVIKKKHAF